MIVRSRAPLRLGLAGGGTDVSPFCDLHGGCVMNVTINQYAYVTLESAPLNQLEFYTQDSGQYIKTSPESLKINANDHFQLITGTYLYLCENFLSGERPPLRIFTHSDAPPGSGLGSSSAMVVALVTAFSEYFSLALGEYDIAHISFKIEREKLKLSGGKQDQYASAFGGFNFMEFYDQGKVVVNPLRVKEWIWSELESSLVLYFTGISRFSAKIIDEQSRNIMDMRTGTLDAMHQLKAEAIQMKEALLRGQLRNLAEIMQSGWEAKKMSATSISNSAIDRVEKLAVSNGAQATKISGAGGGGFMMFICDPVDRVRLVSALSTTEGSVYNASFTQNGAMAWRKG